MTVLDLLASRTSLRSSTSGLGAVPMEKDVLMALIQNAFDNDFFTADNKFLTGSIKSGQSDSTLSLSRQKIVMCQNPRKAIR